ncbi:MAG: DUF6056 family protein [Succinivibrio sp.]
MKNLSTNAYLAVWFVFIAFLAYTIPFVSNDYRYAMIEGTENTVSSVADIIVSEYRHYFTWGGRTPPHTLAQFLLWGGKYVCAISTAFCYIFLIALICIYAKGRDAKLFRLPLKAVLFITVMLWLCLRAYGEVIFMLVTSCNYLYTTVFILLYLLPYRLSITDERVKSHSLLFSLLMFFLGLIAGWCNENTGFAICAVTFLYCIYMYCIKELRFWQLSGFAGMCTGFLVLVLSPGNKVRLEMMEANGNFDYVAHLPVAFGILLLSLAEELPLIISFIWLLYKIKKYDLYSKYKKQMLSTAYIFILGSASLLIMVFSPNFPARTVTTFTVCTIAAVVSLYVILKKENVKIVNTSVFVIFYVSAFAYIAVTGSNAIGAALQAKTDMKSRHEMVDEMIRNGERNLVVPPLTVSSSRYIFISDVATDTNFFVNKIMKRYYHVDSIVKTCDYKMTVSHSDLIIYQHYGKPVCSVKDSASSEKKK